MENSSFLGWEGLEEPSCPHWGPGGCFLGGLGELVKQREPRRTG